MIRRFFQWIVRLLLECDKVICFVPRWLVALLFFVVLGRGALPETDRSISGWVGKCAEAGADWALTAQTIVNFIMRNPNHCRNAITNDGTD